MGEIAGWDELLTIGRFSEMTRLSIKALRIYAGMGLLRPAKISDGSGYRYYHESQAERAEAIRMLRTIDMPLEEIRRALDGTPAAGARAIAEHHDRLVSGRDRLERLLAISSDLTDGRKSLMSYDITVKEIDSFQAVSIRMQVSMTTVERHIQTAFGEVTETLERRRVAPVGPPLIEFHDVIDDETDGDIELCFPVGAPVPAEGRVSGRTLEGGTVASTLHRGRYMEVAPAYHALARWMHQQGWHAAGPPREIYLNSADDVAETDLLTEVQWPMER